MVWDIVAAVKNAAFLQTVWMSYTMSVNNKYILHGIEFPIEKFIEITGIIRIKIIILNCLLYLEQITKTIYHIS